MPATAAPGTLTHHVNNRRSGRVDTSLAAPLYGALCSVNFLSGPMARTFRPLRPLTGWRRVALHAWNRPADPQVYGTLDLAMEKALAYLERLRAEHSVRVTVTHLVAKGLATAVHQYPNANGIVSGRRIYLRSTVDIFLQVATEGGADLSGLKIERADEKSVVEIARETWARAERIRRRQDPTVERTKRLLDRLPHRLVGPLMRLLEFATYDLGLDLAAFGVAKDQFGSAMVSNVGTFGLTFGLAPLVPFSRTPIVVLVGEVRRRPVADDDDMVRVRPMLTLGCTFDHRFIDGFQAGAMAQVLRQVVEDPERHLG